MARYSLEPLANIRPRSIRLPAANERIAKLDTQLGQQRAQFVFGQPVHRSGMGRHPHLLPTARGER